MDWYLHREEEEMRDERSQGSKESVFQLETKRMYYCCEFITILDHCTSFSFLSLYCALTFAILLSLPLTPSHLLPIVSYPVIEWILVFLLHTEWEKNETDERG